MDSYNFHQLLKETYDELSARGFETSRADWLLADISGMTRTEIILKYHDPVPDEILVQYLKDRERMYKGEPVQYIVGFAEFYGRNFNVTQDVLIPRPETEELVYQTMLSLNKDCKTVCDIGTGSGAIAITLKKERPELNVIATDISIDALQIAQQNAKKHKVEIEFLHGKSLEPLIQNNIKVDVLVSNPPYIADEERNDMSSTVLDYEPHKALFATDDGLAIYKEILRDIDKVVNTNGIIIFEIGHLQGDILKTYIREHYQVEDLKVIKDINQNNRMIQFIWKQ